MKRGRLNSVDPVSNKKSIQWLLVLVLSLVLLAVASFVIMRAKSQVNKDKKQDSTESSKSTQKDETYNIRSSSEDDGTYKDSVLPGVE